MATSAEATRAADTITFAHNSERQFARLLDFYRVEWEYEPTAFPIEWDAAGHAVQHFRPDFYLPRFDLYIEITTLNQRLVTKKNRKVRRLRELYPDVRIRVLYQRDYLSLLAKYGLEPPSQMLEPAEGGPAVEAAGEGGPPPAGEALGPETAQAAEPGSAGRRASRPARGESGRAGSGGAGSGGARSGGSADGPEAPERSGGPRSGGPRSGGAPDRPAGPPGAPGPPGPPGRPEGSSEAAGALERSGSAPEAAGGTTTRPGGPAGRPHGMAQRSGGAALARPSGAPARAGDAAARAGGATEGSGGAVERVRAAGRPRVVPDPPRPVPPLPADPELVRLAQVLLPAERAHRRGPATAKRAG
jgi:hypothetical protein